MAIEACADLRSYFYERLRAAQTQLSHQTDGATEHYLVELLARYSRSDCDLAKAQDPLVFQVAKADAATEPAERLARFRQVGDSALYSSGVFPERLARRGISREYVAAIGRRAYGRAASLARYSAEPYQAVYPTLGRHFEVISQVLEEAVDESPPQSPSEIVRLYRIWQRTGSTRVASRLKAAGVRLDDSKKRH